MNISCFFSIYSTVYGINVTFMGIFYKSGSEWVYFNKSGSFADILTVSNLLMHSKLGSVESTATGLATFKHQHLSRSLW